MRRALIFMAVTACGRGGAALGPDASAIDAPAGADAAGGVDAAAGADAAVCTPPTGLPMPEGLDAFEQRWAQVTCERAFSCCLPGTLAGFAQSVGLAAVPATVEECATQLLPLRHQRFLDDLALPVQRDEQSFVPDACLDWSALLGCEDFRAFSFGAWWFTCGGRPLRHEGDTCTSDYSCTGYIGYTQCVDGRCLTHGPIHGIRCGGPCPEGTYCDTSGPSDVCAPLVAPCATCTPTAQGYPPCEHHLPCTGICTIPATVPVDCAHPG